MARMLALRPTADIAAPPSGSSLVEAAYAAMKTAIRDNVFPPGHQAAEPEIARQLGMSRTPVHEAIIRLQEEGLVQVLPRRGVVICPISAEDIREIYDVLISLEPRAAELLAARGASSKELDRLKASCEKMTDTLRRGEMEQWALADEEFHLGIVQLSNNRRLVDIVLNCWDQVHRARYFTLRLRQHPQPSKSIEEHYEIIEAIRQGDANAARRLYRRHRERGLREQIDVMTAFRIHQI